MTRALVVLAVLLGAGPSSGAEPPQQAACVAAYERAQPLREQGKLLAARAELITCAQTSCAESIVAECARWLHEVDDATPTLVPGAREGTTDLVDVRVFIDDQKVASRLEGTAFPVDPGEHVLRFERPAGGAMTTRVLMRQGEKNRLVTIQFAPPPRKEPPRPAPQPPLAAYVLAGVAVAAIAVGATLDVSASSDLKDLHNQCAPTCDPGTRDEVRRRMIVGDVLLFGVSSLSLAGAAYLFFARREPSRD